MGFRIDSGMGQGIVNDSRRPVHAHPAACHLQPHHLLAAPLGDLDESVWFIAFLNECGAEAFVLHMHRHGESRKFIWSQQAL